ncbi:FAD-linked oxidoreductase patO [Colletotrichum liriopes]|uniref:FAD-linked oxidoreductase patO n=1 Tax=Colletotrichum liriopes TaxID=708192 RepID=A0AA37GPX2_9PEZI|nr:FAD-linked oxidoreductase patO [Colletotrichum liriopes]
MGGLTAGEFCKCSPSDLCWPSSSEWDTFNRTISGQLIHTVPPGSVCYPAEPNYDKESCDIVLSNWTSSIFHSSDPASVSSAWSNSTCVPIYSNGTSVDGDPDAGKRGCSLGALPPYVVNVTDASQVQKALRFANQRNLRVVVKNTGHNGAGRLVWTGMDSIWTHNLKQTEFHEKFQASGCSTNTTWKASQMAITIGAGIQDGELLDFAKQNEVVAVAGTNKGVKGYYTIGGPPSSTTIGLSSSMFLWNKANGTAGKLLAPLQQLLSANNGTVTGSIVEVPVQSFYDLISTVPVYESGARSSTITAARLITQNVVVNEQDLLAEILEEVGTRVTAPEDGMPNLSMSGTMTIGHEHVDNALNPAWRNSVVHLITQQTWDRALPSVNVSEVVSDMTYNKLNALRRLDPGSGTYLNEANTFEPAWQWSFFGPNYGRLRSIKETYDPAGLLWCPQCVGSEDWVQGEDGKLCKAYQPFH